VLRHVTRERRAAAGEASAAVGHARSGRDVIVGVGIDVCDVARIRRALEGKTGARFRDRVFTPGEQAYCEARRRGRYTSFAARFAAKEAAMKALGTGWADGVGWRDFEVVRATGEPPRLVLHGRAAAIARRRGMVRWLLALTHTADTAVASVVAEDGAGVRGARAKAARDARAAGARSAPRRPRARR
jgi:holo-[acyl-carrier protein] synthase